MIAKDFARRFADYLFVSTKHVIGANYVQIIESSSKN